MEMIIALNNKSNLDKEGFIPYINSLRKVPTEDQLIVCPGFLNISSVPEGFDLGAQNVSCEGPGAYTGEVSASQLKSYGVRYCIVGHSERRDYQRESYEEIHKKIQRLFESGITPILCVGETKEERENNQVNEVLMKELSTAISELSEEEKSKMIIAYEPIWSIGTGIIPTNEQIIEVFQFIKLLLPHTKVLYGGSANEENIEYLRQISEIDGYLLGGLSLKPEKLEIFLQKLH